MTPIQGALGTLPAVQASPASPASPAPSTKNDAELQRAAREFEAVFLRLILTPLEKATKVGKGPGASGGDAYGSMVVGALADSISAAGGLGLADVVVQSLTRADSAGLPEIGRLAGTPNSRR